MQCVLHYIFRVLPEAIERERKHTVRAKNPPVLLSFAGERGTTRYLSAGSMVKPARGRGRGNRKDNCKGKALGWSRAEE